MATGTVSSLALYEGDLVAGGHFSRAGDVLARSLARWNGLAGRQGVRLLAVVDHGTLAVAVAGFKHLVGNLAMAVEEFHLQVLQPLHVVVHAPQAGHDPFQAVRIVVAVVAFAEPVLRRIEQEVAVEIRQGHRTVFDAAQVRVLARLAVHRVGRETVQQHAVVNRLVQRHPFVDVRTLRQRQPLVAVHVQQPVQRRCREIQRALGLHAAKRLLCQGQDARGGFGILPARFVSKAEVRGWPVIGWMAEAVIMPRREMSAVSTTATAS